MDEEAKGSEEPKSGETEVAQRSRRTPEQRANSILARYKQLTGGVPYDSAALSLLIQDEVVRVEAEEYIKRMELAKTLVALLTREEAMKGRKPTNANPPE